MFSETKRRESLIKAWDSKGASISQKILLLEGKKIGNEPGFILSFPVHNNSNGEYPKGFVFAPLLINELFDSIFKGRYERINIDVFEGTTTAPDKLIYDLNRKKQQEESDHSDLTSVITIPAYNSFLTIRLHPFESYVERHSFLKELMVIVFGLFVTLLIFWIYRLTCKQVVIVETAKQVLEDAVQARDEFFSIASHEFKTPLTSLKLQTQLFKRSALKKDPKVNTEEYINNITKVLENQIIRIERLVDDMLDVSRIRTGKFSIEKSEFQLSEVVKDVVNRMSEQLKILPEQAPVLDFDGDTTGTWDKFRLEQVITNLISNAIKYGHGTTIKIDVFGKKNEVTLKVHDQGEGIDPSNHEKIFNRFERVGMAPRGISGLGLGLYITKRIVEAHGGSIWVESELGKGSCFIVRLPKVS